MKLLAAPFSKAVHFGVDDVNELASMIAEEEGFGGAGGSYADDSGSSVNQRTSKSYLLLKNDAISDTSSSSNEEKELGARPAEYQMSSDEPTPGSTQQTTSTAAATTATTTRMIKKKAMNEKKYRLPKLVSVYASRACRSAIMIGTALKHSEMRSILDKLPGVEQPWNCPHGRPTVRHLADLNALLDKNCTQTVYPAAHQSASFW